MKVEITNWAQGKSGSFFIVVVMFASLGACAGNMQGVVRGTGQTVSINYEQGMSSDSLTAVIDGEDFAGKTVMRGATTTFGNAFGAAMTTFVGTSTSGDFVATLLGNRGSTLSCDLQYADVTGFTTAGGVGVCRHSDGRIIDIIW